MHPPFKTCTLHLAGGTKQCPRLGLCRYILAENDWGVYLSAPLYNRKTRDLRPNSLRRYFRCDHVDDEDGGSPCLAAFYSAKELVVHKRKHTGELPFICGYCGNRYRSKATLVQHERQQHFGTEVNSCTALHFEYPYQATQASIHWSSAPRIPSPLLKSS